MVFPIFEKGSESMKLEKLNDNQIRCTLSRADLDKRHLRLSELAYGSAKARALFRDLIRQASDELGFEADNIPLMIEAIPVSSDCLVLVVTKVEDTDELDTRFSRFSTLSEELPDEDDYNTGFTDEAEDFDGTDFEEYEEAVPFGESFESSGKSRSAEDPLDLLAPFTQAIAQAKKEVLKKRREAAESKESMQLYVFRSLDRIIELSAFLCPFYTGASTLFKDKRKNCYYLFFLRDNISRELYTRACTLACDYGTRSTSSYASLSYCQEHFELMFEGNALEMLNQLNN